MSTSSQSLHFILSLRMNSSFITSRSGVPTYLTYSVFCVYEPSFVLEFSFLGVQKLVNFYEIL